MSRSLAAAFMLCFALAAFPVPGRCAQQEPVALQISSAVSGSGYSLEQIIGACRKNGVKVVILSERDLMRWEYGLWPLRGLVKKTVEERSLLRYGVRRYLEEIRRLREANPDMLIVTGVESAPYYYWSGNPFNGSLVINDWHRHLLSFGFRSEAGLRALPVAGNAGGKGYDPYGGDRGPVPYQRYVDYAQAQGALTFWSHPDAANRERLGSVRSETADYSELLTRVDGYTGFLVFYEGYRRTGVCEGVWDEVLQDYCAGRRKRPVWAAAGLAVDAEGGLDERLKTLRTVVLLDSLSEDALVSAMGGGRMYVAYGEDAPRFSLDEFSVSAGAASAGMGGEIAAGTQFPVITLRGRLQGEPRERVQITLIRNGHTYRVFDLDGPEFSVSVSDDEAPAGKGYYRAEINSHGVKAIANPVFYTRERQ